MHLIKIKLDEDTCQILEQTKILEKTTAFIFRASNGKKVYSYDYPDYIQSTNAIYLRGYETARDLHVFGYDKDYIKAMNEFCEYFEWRFIICI